MAKSIRSDNTFHQEKIYFIDFWKGTINVKLFYSS